MMSTESTAPMSTILDGVRGADDHAALVEPAAGEHLTYGELRGTVDAIGRQLVAHGVVPGDVVAMTGANGPEMLVAFLGIIAAGAAAAPLNPAYTTDEFGAYLRDFGPRAMLFAGDAGAAARAACAQLEVAALDLEGSGPRSRVAGVPAAPARPADSPDAVALLLHTSGTTSRPKGVPLRQRNLAASAAVIAAHYGLGEDDVSHCVMPLFHVHGLLASALATLASGGTVLVPRRFTVGSFWEHGAAYGATWYSAVPTIHTRLLARGAPDYSALRFARSCSSALAPTLLRAFEDCFELPLVEAYGMTEASHQMTSNPLPPAERRAGSVGCATGVEVAVLDDAWRALGPDAVGEVAVRGASVVDGYRNNEEANAASFRDGWFRTGDSGSLGGDGYLTLQGRLKELINRGGEKISPHEVEDALLSHPGVREAVAFAVPDPKLGEQVAAAVVGSDLDPGRLTAHCAERVAQFKVPGWIVVVDEIPKGPTGKVQRRLLSEQLGT
jgi:acyl-CoA synthetase (AMP-forming)/AMP-acid ligase II